MLTKLEGLTVLITGASGGIGEALAETFADESCQLALLAHARHRELCERVSTRPWRSSAACLSADLRDAESVDRVFLDCREQFGRVDVCVVNAGIWPPSSVPLAELDAARIRDVIEINVLGAMFSARAFLRSLAATGARSDGRGASLCFIGSTAGRFGEAGHSAYAASKAALSGLVRTLKNEIVDIDPYGRVNMVEPGWTATPMAADALANDDAVRSVAATMPLRQLARAKDIAHAVAFLSAPQLSRHITGEILTVAGGMEGRTQWQPHEVDVSSVRRRLDPD